jgi:hypothetical protein
MLSVNHGHEHPALFRAEMAQKQRCASQFSYSIAKFDASSIKFPSHQNLTFWHT